VLASALVNTTAPLMGATAFVACRVAILRGGKHGCSQQ
jgi:hypothetical protein